VKRVKVLVACGSGIATSSIAVYKVETLCKEIGVDAQIIKTTIKEIPEKSDSVDLILTTSRYQGQSSKPVESVVSFLTGIREDETKEKIKQILLDLANA